MGKIIYDEKEGYQFISDNGILYDLFEGVSLKGKTISDIVFIMLSYDEDMAIDSEDNFVNWFCGATFFNRDKESLETLDTYVNMYEEEHPYIVKQFKTCIERKIKATVETYLEVNKEVLSEEVIKDLEKQIEYLENKIEKGE